MNEIIKIDFEKKVISARELHEQLKIRTSFKDWFPRMCEYGFEEGKDFCSKMSETSCKGGRPSKDADISINMAKEICMIQRTPEGRAIRQYLISLEDAWNSPEQVWARALKMADDTINSLKDRCNFLGGQIAEQTKVIEELKPKASYYDLILQCKDLITTTAISKDYGFSAKRFNEILHELGVQFKHGDTWFLYSNYQGNGYMQSKTHNYYGSDGLQHAKQHSYWTQKGRLFLYDLLKQENILPMIEKGD